MSIYAPKQRPINLGLAPTPEMGPRVIGSITLNFPGNGAAGFTNVITDDFIFETENGTIDPIQSVYFDNSNNSSIIQFTILDTGQQINFPAGAQGYLPLLCFNSFRYSAVGWVSAAGPLNLFFFNVPIQPYIWNPSGLGVRGMASMANTLVGNTAINVAVGSAYGKHVRLNGFYVGGNGATAATDIQVTVNPLEQSPQQTQAHVYDVFVPVIGTGVTDYYKSFNPPIISGTNGSGLPSVAVPAMGAGNTYAVAIIYYSVDG